MAVYSDSLDIVFDVAEDLVIQLFWTDVYGLPIPITSPVQCDVKDANGQIIMRFAENTDPTVEPRITYITSTGFIQMTAPRIVTEDIPPGMYNYDIFAGVVSTDSATFNSQVKKIIGGRMIAEQNVTYIAHVEPLTADDQAEV